MRRWLKELGINQRKENNSPFSDAKQKRKQQVILNKISREELRASNDCIDVIMDDETYIDMNGHDSAGNNSFFTSGLLPVPDTVKFKTKTKFPKKLLMWLAVSRKGHSKPYFHCLQRQAKKVLKEFTPDYFHRLMSSVGQMVKAAARNGVLSVIN